MNEHGGPFTPRFAVQKGLKNGERRLPSQRRRLGMWAGLLRWRGACLAGQWRPAAHRQNFRATWQPPPARPHCASTGGERSTGIRLSSIVSGRRSIAAAPFALPSPSPHDPPPSAVRGLPLVCCFSVTPSGQRMEEQQILWATRLQIKHLLTFCYVTYINMQDSM